MKKKMIVVAVVSCALLAPLGASAMDHDAMPMEHGSMKMEHGGGMMVMGKMAHEEVVDGVKATFKVIDIKAKMEKMGQKATHHIMVMFTDAKTGKMLSKGEATVKVLAPDKTTQVKPLMGMEGGFGADFTMPGTGKYGVMCKFRLADGKTRSVKFWYQVK